MTRGTLALALFLGPLRQSKGRAALALAAIALGVALGYAVQLVNQSAIAEFAQAVQTLSGTADIEIRGPRSGFDEALYPRLARRPEVAVASPVIEADLRVDGRTEPLRVFGLDVFRASQVQPDVVATSATDGLDALRPDAVFLSPAAATWLGVGEGDTLEVQAGLTAFGLRIAGLTRADGTRFGRMDIAGLQARLERFGRIDRLDLRLRPGVDVDSFRAALQRELPPGVLAARPEASIERAANMSRSYRVNLNVLALVALFTGALLVFSTQALAVVRRRAQFALLRVLGLQRRALVALVLGEALLVGIAGAALGLVLGYALAQTLLDVVGADLGAGHFRALRPALRSIRRGRLPSSRSAWPIARGQPPAGARSRARAAGRGAQGGRRAAGVRAAPVRVARTRRDRCRRCDQRRTAGRWPAALRLRRDRAAADRHAHADALARDRGVRAHAGRTRGAGAARRARSCAARPGRRAVARGIVAAVSLLVSMAIMVASFRHSLEAWLEHVLPADVYVRTGSAGGDGGGLTPRDQETRRRSRYERESSSCATQSLLLAPERPAVTLLARPIDAADAGRLLALVGASVTPPRGCTAAGVGHRGDGRSLRLCTWRRHRAADRRARRALHGRRRVARLRAAATARWSSSANATSR